MTAPQASPDPDVTYTGPAAAGRLLGVDERTIVRWTDDGTLPLSHRTVGGHRRYRLDDVLKLREQQVPTDG